MDTPIEICGLVKSFAGHRALDGLDLQVAAGEVHGFLGPNGAGKSTTLRVLLGLLRPDGDIRTNSPTAGRPSIVRLLGGDPWRDAGTLHRRLAYVPGDVTLWPTLTGGEVIDLLGRMRGGLDPTRRKDLLAEFQLDPTKKARTYSKGNRQKVALVAALASDVELLLLDEPTSGLDPLMEEVFRRTIVAAREQGRTVLLSSHILSEVEALCDRVSIVRAGRTVDSGTLGELRHLTRTAVDATVKTGPGELAALGRPAGVHDLVVEPVAEGSRVRCQVDAAALDDLLAALAGAHLLSLTSRPPTLEELFLRHYEVDGGKVSSEVSR